MCLYSVLCTLALLHVLIAINPRCHQWLLLNFTVQRDVAVCVASKFQPRLGVLCAAEVFRGARFTVIRGDDAIIIR